MWFRHTPWCRRHRGTGLQRGPGGVEERQLVAFESDRSSERAIFLIDWGGTGRKRVPAGQKPVSWNGLANNWFLLMIHPHVSWNSEIGVGHVISRDSGKG